MAEEIIRCKRCGNELGRAIIVDKIELFEYGGLILREARGRCKNCGEPFYYSVSDRALEQLLKTMVNVEVHE